MYSHFPTSFLMRRKYSPILLSSGEMALVFFSPSLYVTVMIGLEESGEGLDFPLRLS